LAEHTDELILVMDGGEVGRDCVALMVGVVYGGQALPVLWQVRQDNKGHFSQEEHLPLLENLVELVPKGVRVGFCGAWDCFFVWRCAKISLSPTLIAGLETTGRATVKCGLRL
jgi:hypothetical protein